VTDGANRWWPADSLTPGDESRSRCLGERRDSRRRRRPARCRFVDAALPVAVSVAVAVALPVAVSVAVAVALPVAAPIPRFREASPGEAVKRSLPLQRPGTVIRRAHPRAKS